MFENGKTKKWKTKMEHTKHYLFTSEVVSPGHPDKYAERNKTEHSGSIDIAKAIEDGRKRANSNA